MSTEICAICHKPLLGESWIDDDEYGDVHERCLEAEQLGYVLDDEDGDSI